MGSLLPHSQDSPRPLTSHIGGECGKVKKPAAPKPESDMKRICEDRAETMPEVLGKDKSRGREWN